MDASTVLMIIGSNVISIAEYVWGALCLFIIARKLNSRYPWLAWIPIANIYLMCKVGGKPGWWTAIFCILFILLIPGLIALVSLPLMFLGFILGGGEGGIPSWYLPAIAIAIVAGLVSLVLNVIVWMGISKARNYPPALGLLIIVPMANLVLPGILAFADRPAPTPVQSPVAS